MKAKPLNGHNLVEAHFQPRVITIIGGKGSMGSRLAEEFSKDGYEVRQTGEEVHREIDPVLHGDWKRAVRRWNTNACKDADVVMFSVPIPLLRDGNGLSRIFGHTPPRGWRGKLVIDICSTKTGPLSALSELNGPAVIGTHPMFGPKVKSLTGQTVFVCPVFPPGDNKVLQARLAVRGQWLKEFWQRRGVNVVEISPEEHDALMPTVQFGVLLPILLYADCLRRSGAALERLQHLGTPNSRALCARLARMISPSMIQTYVNIVFDNPHNANWVEAALESLTQFKRWMATEDRQAMLAWMQELAAFQPSPFRDHFAASSVFLDECLAKRDFLTACLGNEALIRNIIGKSADIAQLRAA